MKQMPIGKTDLLSGASQMRRNTMANGYAKPLTEDEATLLLALRDSLKRGAASMSCGGFRMSTSMDLLKKGLIKSHTFSSTFFTITDAGLDAVKNTKPPKQETKNVREKSHSEVVTGRWEKDSNGKWVSVPHYPR